MEKKTPKMFFGYSVLLIMVGVISLRYYYASSTTGFAISGIALLGLGFASLLACTIYTLLIKGHKKLAWLFSSSVTSLLLGFALLFLVRYKHSHLAYSNSGSELDLYTRIAQPTGAVLFLIGLVLLGSTIGLAIARKPKAKQADS